MDSHALFKPTRDEIELTEYIRRATLHKSTGAFSRDVAIRIFKESGLSFKQIREIWTIADRGGDGKLSNDEMCVAVRLAGWVQQRGEIVSESLLTSAGPLPVLKGVSYTPRRPEDSFCQHDAPSHSDAPPELGPPMRLRRPQRNNPYHEHNDRNHFVEFPPVTLELQKTCRNLFESTGTVHGLMDKETVQEILMQHLGASFFILKPILNLVRTSSRLSLNIREFTLASYFVTGLQSGAIRALPTEVPAILYDQLWTPTLLSCTPDDSLSKHQIEFRTCTASSNGELQPLQLSPVRKLSQVISFQQCPSVSSVETKKITTLWKHVAKRCKIDKFLKMSSTSKSQRGSPRVSDVSVNGTVETQSSKPSFGALESNSFFHPPREGGVSIETTCLPLIYPSKTGYYAAPDRVPVEVQQSVTEGIPMQDSVTGPFATAYEELVTNTLSGLRCLPLVPPSPIPIAYKEPSNEHEGDGTSVVSAVALEQRVGNEAEVENMGVEVEGKQEATTDVLAMFANIKDECTLLRLQMQIMQKAIRRLEMKSVSLTKSTHSKGVIEEDPEGRVRDSIRTDSGTSIWAQSLKLATKFGGPRNMRSIRSVPAVLPSQARRNAGGLNYHSCSEQEGLEHVQSSKSENRRSMVSSRTYISRHASQPRDGRMSNKAGLRSTWQVKGDRISAKKPTMVNQDVRSRTTENLQPPAMTTKRHEHKRVVGESAISGKQLHAGNEGRMPDDRILTREKTHSTTAESNDTLSGPPRNWSIQKALSPEKPKKVKAQDIPPLPLEPLSKFSDIFADKRADTSSCGLVRKASSVTDVNISSSPSGVSWKTSSGRGINEIYANVLRDFLSTDFETRPDTRPASASTALMNVDTQMAHSMDSPTLGHFSILSAPGSACTTLMTRSVYNDTGMNESRDAAPELVAQVEECLGGTSHTNFGGSSKSVYNDNVIFDDGMEAAQQYVQAMMDWVAAPLQISAQGGVCLEDDQEEFLRQQARELTMLQWENESLRWLIADQEKQIYYLGGSIAAPAHHSVEPPKYTSGW